MHKITLRQVQIFKKYSGDEDTFVRVAPEEEQRDMPDSSWFAIGKLIQELLLIERGLASDAYEKLIEERLGANTVVEAADAIRELARQDH